MTQNRTPRPETSPNDRQGRVQIASGWWTWFIGASSLDGGASRRSIVFSHEVHRHWNISAEIEAAWDGVPSAQELAHSATKLTAFGDPVVRCELFVLPGYIFLQSGRGDTGQLTRHDGRPLGDLTEAEIVGLLTRRGPVDSI